MKSAKKTNLQRRPNRLSRQSKKEQGQQTGAGSHLLLLLLLNYRLQL